MLGRLSAPETVQAEVLRKSNMDERFRPAATAWRKLTAANFIDVLSDSETPELSAVVHRITQTPMADRLRQPKDLGELMVIAHAVVAAETGTPATVLIDDGLGGRIATAEIRRLQRLATGGHPVGSIRLVSTVTVLQRAARTEFLPDRAAMRDLYKRLREVDDGLPPIETTVLLSRSLWSKQTTDPGESTER